MTKEFLQEWARVLEKYGVALSMLYPSQSESLQEYYCYFLNYGKTPRIDDSFLRLAFLMIVADRLHEERGNRL